MLSYYFFSAFFFLVVLTSITPFSSTYQPVIFSSMDYRFEHPTAISIDLEGNAWVRSNHNVTKIPFTSPQIPVVYSYFYTNVPTPFEDICSDSKGNIWFTDSFSDSVIVIPKANPNHTISYSGSSKYGFSKPKFIVIDSKDNVWVAGSLSTITEIPANNTRNPVFYSMAGYISKINGIAIDSKDNIWVANSENFGVTLIPASDRFSPINYIGSNYGYNFLIAITTDPYDNVWVLSSTTSSTYSQYVLTQIPAKNPWGPIIYSSFKFDQPQRIASDLEGNIWVTNTKGNTVIEFPVGDRNNPIVYSDSSYRFGGPYGITVDYLGNIWITNDNIRSVTKLQKTVGHVQISSETGETLETTAK